MLFIPILQCAVTENINTPPTEGIETSYGWRVQDDQDTCNKAELEFSEGWVLEKILFVGKVWTFSGTTQ